MASTVTREMQDQFLSTVRKSQEIALDAIKTMVDTIQNITPKVPSVSMPFADRLPKPEDVVAAATTSPSSCSPASGSSPTRL